MKLLVLDKNTWNHVTVHKQISSNNLFKNKLTYKLFAYKSSLSPLLSPPSLSLYIYIYIYIQILFHNQKVTQNKAGLNWLEAFRSGKQWRDLRTSTTPIPPKKQSSFKWRRTKGCNEMSSNYYSDKKQLNTYMTIVGARWYIQFCK